jgi:hypothetical protein
MYIKKHKTIFIGSKLVASTSILENLAPLSDDDSFSQMVSATEASTRYTPVIYKKSFKFSFVRNPWDRVVSAFFQKPPSLLENLTFESFLHQALTDKRDSLLSLLPSQTENLKLHGKIHMDYVGRFETLYRDWKTACMLSGVPHTRLPRLKKSVRFSHRFYYRTPEMIAIVAKHFEEEIDTFEFAFEEK